ncbi:hypothetical protein WN55_00460 [Dufourea novaeangliae]|uniref:Uncharacterized protein n=1 Tax=Dufourea novaeangliae TaxID=178035 RepID=A0A154PEG3_DUFNO|nr:hypothetical protein WN55_00460 [Dufourea novaeangliae]
MHHEEETERKKERDTEAVCCSAAAAAAGSTGHDGSVNVSENQNPQPLVDSEVSRPQGIFEVKPNRFHCFAPEQKSNSTSHRLGASGGHMLKRDWLAEAFARRALRVIEESVPEDDIGMRERTVVGDNYAAPSDLNVHGVPRQLDTGVTDRSLETLDRTWIMAGVATEPSPPNPSVLGYAGVQ